MCSATCTEVMVQPGPAPPLCTLSPMPPPGTACSAVPASQGCREDGGPGAQDPAPQLVTTTPPPAPSPSRAPRKAPESSWGTRAHRGGDRRGLKGSGRLSGRRRWTPKGGSQREAFNPRKEGRRGAGSEEWEGGWRLGVRWGVRWRQGPGSEGSEVGAVAGPRPEEED